MRRPQAKILVWVAHVPVGGDEARHEVEHLEGLARIGRRLVGKVAHFDPCCEEALRAYFGELFDVADIVGDFCWDGRGRLEKMGGKRGWLGHVRKGIVDRING